MIIPVFIRRDPPEIDPRDATKVTVQIIAWAVTVAAAFLLFVSYITGG